ncbi:CYTH domain-containing protein [Enterococcus sp. MJM12]|uniref:CYTH domain-containing protein n=1 Tax=Candidatus Enterococcus myersii TaxID=2815322 RepID=A0ABS3H9J2_9ENTE|nr:MULTISPECIES: CYTH domain-containing protein [Enterococcus]MBO0450129.1 CYTH domain-containing protein [Enterococcus sp. MJM12]WHA09822.1 CYTH domain-containing protein [Enterococcus montenegrensis]
MSQSTEIEFKTMLSATDFKRIMTYYHVTDEMVVEQTNCYFDTFDNKLKNANAGLRIRLLPSFAEVTLKTPQQEGLLETTEKLTLAEAQKYLTLQQVPANGPVEEKLKTLHVTLKELHIISQLTTKRAEFEIDAGLLALDESFYLPAGHDFELELEVKDAKLGQEAFTQLLKTLAVSYIPAENKISRSLKKKQS